MGTGKVIRCGVVPECNLTEDPWQQCLWECVVQTVNNVWGTVRLHFGILFWYAGETGRRIKCESLRTTWDTNDLNCCRNGIKTKGEKKCLCDLVSVKEQHADRQPVIFRNVNQGRSLFEPWDLMKINSEYSKLCLTAQQEVGVRSYAAYKVRRNMMSPGEL